MLFIDMFDIITDVACYCWLIECGDQEEKLTSSLTSVACFGRDNFLLPICVCTCALMQRWFAPQSTDGSLKNVIVAIRKS